ncbi:hypothetical protein CYMTET_13617 [Cymbomonas tetramitiformis]|uniref:N-acetyltransferase domain-containing protein n=1 Tax=Cymbomonas tetramitiformis TaxID=36881 RepID=A0AAE0GI41_9CHLO|nr:hypothetical protein CYMTET_13617 [Cymbomonas tetramitiformis]
MISEESESGNDTVSLVPANKENVDTLANLNAVLFPITYQKKFYIDCLACGPYTVMAQLNGSIVAAICCRLETHQDLGVRLYIMTLGVLAPYRRRGIANALLGHALRLAQQDPRIVDTYLHVQLGNEEAIAFYRSNGFELIATIKNYYKRIRPADCFVFSCNLRNWQPRNSCLNHA